MNNPQISDEFRKDFEDFSQMVNDQEFVRLWKRIEKAFAALCDQSEPLSISVEEGRNLYHAAIDRLCKSGYGGNYCGECPVLTCNDNESPAKRLAHLEDKYRILQKASTHDYNARTLLANDLLALTKGTEVQTQLAKEVRVTIEKFQHALMKLKTEHHTTLVQLREAEDRFTRAEQTRVPKCLACVHRHTYHQTPPCDTCHKSETYSEFQPQPYRLMGSDSLREALAKYAHDAWAGWMRYLFSRSIGNQDGTTLIPKSLTERWTRQLSTPYQNLPENEKESDRKEADLMWGIVNSNQKPQPLSPSVPTLEELRAEHERYCEACRNSPPCGEADDLS